VACFTNSHVISADPDNIDLRGLRIDVLPAFSGEEKRQSDAVFVRRYPLYAAQKKTRI